jgi:hypothetical protein
MIRFSNLSALLESLKLLKYAGLQVDGSETVQQIPAAIERNPEKLEGRPFVNQNSHSGDE